MPSPVTPADFEATIPAATSDLCSKFKLVLITFPRLVWQFVDWMLDSDGAVSNDFIAEVSQFYAGDLKWSASSVVPSEFWLLCNGQAVSRTTYAALFAAIGTTYGAGDSSTTFNLPDFRDRFPVGVSGAKALGDVGGEETHILTTTELPSHTHQVGSQDSTAGDGGAISQEFVRDFGSGTGPATTSSGTGDGTAHNNLPPYLAAYVYIHT